ncbi:MAG: phosphotransferase [Acidimicrobiales bacterium]
MTDRESAMDFATRLTCWTQPVVPEPLHGGITNTNFVVRDGDDSYVVRIGDDLPLHGVVRSHEVVVARAAHACGLSPEIIHHQPGAMVMRFVEAKTLTSDDIAKPEMLRRVTELTRKCHDEMANQLRGATLMFWVFQVSRGYIDAAAGGRLTNQLSELGKQNERLERLLGPIQPVFCHNDLLPANFLDDGDSLWLLDWEYAGWNSAMFDLANLASNAELCLDDQTLLLETYLDRSVQPQDTASLQTMKCASLLRETLWSLVQEDHSSLDFDYESYTDDYLARFKAEYASLEAR